MFDEHLGDGLRLRPLEVWHAEDFLQNVNRGRDHLRPWVHPSFLVEDLHQARAFLGRNARSAADDGQRLFGVWVSDRLIGGATVTAFDAPAGTCEIGCWLEPAGEGRGIATRACARLLRWAFEERGVQRVEWRCPADNARSIEVARRLAMTYEGTLRCAWWIGAGREDLQVWSILAEEWPDAGRPRSDA